MVSEKIKPINAKSTGSKVGLVEIGLMRPGSQDNPALMDNLNLIGVQRQLEV